MPQKYLQKHQGKALHRLALEHDGGVFPVTEALNAVYILVSQIYAAGEGGVEEKQAAMKLLEEDRKGIAVYMVNVDEINSRHPELGQKLMDSFDLSMLPNIYITDKSGRILERYASLL